MRRTAAAALALSLLTIGLSPRIASQGAAQEPSPAQSGPTFNKDVAPILYANCVVCHRPGEVAPMSLMTFADARPWARGIKTKVLTHDMPPWYADPQFGNFTNKPKLTQAQADTLAAWADAGAPEGAGAPPSPPVFRDEWSPLMNRPPDQVIDAPFEFEVPATGDVPTFTVWLKIPFRDDRFVEAMQLVPTNRRVVHHSSISFGDLPPKTKIGKAQAYNGGPVLDGVPVFSDGRPYLSMSGDEFGYPLIFYVPGGGFLRFPQGIAKRLPAGKYFSWGMHYVTTGKPEKVRMRLGLWFAKKDVNHAVETWTVNEKRVVNGKEVWIGAPGRPQAPNIPAGEANYTITGYVGFKDAVTVYSAWPHMHFRGKDMTFIVTYPNGREETVLSVPKYDPNWQITYEFVKPLKLPAGSVMRAIAHYDNSAKNLNNPDPAQEVLWGPQSANEMFLPFIEVSVDKNDLRFDDIQRALQ
jgi:hypothetical protein